DFIAAETEKAGVRACLCYEVSDRDGQDIANAGIRENTRFINQNTNSRTLAGLFGLHAPFTLSDETLACAKKAAGSAGFHVHVAEGIEDVDSCLGRFGLRPLERLQKAGILTEKSIFAHCVHLSQDEIESLASSGCTMAHNPESNLNNAVGLAPILDYLASGVRMGLGTDGFCQGLWYSLRNAFLLPKHFKRDPRVSWAEPLNLLEENSRKASSVFGLPVGKICRGSAADLIALPYIPPTEFNNSNILGHLIFGIMGEPVTDVMCQGSLLMQDRRLLTLDERQICRQSRDLCPQIWERFRSKP
ncbi:MAG: amidohydrolase family protein, partial [Candidatus Wallbacteria bacterium]|nr:amidohydrolase family protein [Candidatus Wallbacteria bacterium]